MCVDGLYIKLKLPKVHFIFAYLYFYNFEYLYWINIQHALIWFPVCRYTLNLWIRIWRYSNTYPVSSQSIWRFSGRYRWGSSKSSRTGSTKNEKKMPFESKTFSETLYLRCKIIIFVNKFDGLLIMW